MSSDIVEDLANAVGWLEQVWFSGEVHIPTEVITDAQASLAAIRETHAIVPREPIELPCRSRLT